MGLFDFLRGRGPARPEPAPASAGPPAPLSDLMTRALEDASGEAMRAFHRAFMDAPIGVDASRVPGGADGVYHTAFARAATPDGRVMVLACADRAAFARRFHDRFNADVRGRELAAAVLGIPDCAGILVNSAASFHSIAIDREQLAFLLAPT
jgi:hypothetical protein